MYTIVLKFSPNFYTEVSPGYLNAVVVFLFFFGCT